MIGEVLYIGKFPSTNQLYTKTWQERKVIQDDFKDRLRPFIIAADLPKLAFFKLKYEYNSRYDVDNAAGGCIKIFVDLMRELKIIHNDTQGIFRGFEAYPNKNLPPQSFKITIY
ncbi:hypothetical protein MUN82_01855 [Hymenobacter aerilatus]|uniref:Uncharacterized protein n=1 Tax=Hymenobacter aerilatus TaxID=2932251 RepID=A0A8T9SVD6_9BACT|nr:hypothetical protein [Hymenobacter aerilatus]UOR05855.1 hypothetical protein MUN82_01855 [Hymenobacter aerilatus]